MSLVQTPAVDRADPRLGAHRLGPGSTGVGQPPTRDGNGGVDADDVFGFNDGNGITLSGGQLSNGSGVIASSP